MHVSNYCQEKEIIHIWNVKSSKRDTENYKANIDIRYDDSDLNKICIGT